MLTDAFGLFIEERLSKRKEDDRVLSSLKSDFFAAKTRDVVEVLIADSQIDEGITSVARQQDEANSPDEYENFLAASGVSIVTVRRAYNQGSSILKPVASFPIKTLVWAEDIAHQIEPQRFPTPEDALEGIEHVHIDKHPVSDGSRYFSAIYETSGGSGIDKERSSKFRDRIDIAFETLKAKDKDHFGSTATCFFSIRARPSADNQLEIAQIFAIYFREDAPLRDGQTLHEAHDLAKVMFRQDEQIRSLEEQLFVLEGHELTSSLQPLFQDSDIAPADKMAFALEKLNHLIKRHLLSHYPVSNREEHETEVIFVSLGYEVPDENDKETVVPIFQVYPHAYRRRFAYGSFLIGHPDRPAVSKYLLRRYLSSGAEANPRTQFLLGTRAYAAGQSKPVQLHQDFTRKLFRDVDNIAGLPTNRTRLGNGYADQISLSKSIASDNGLEEDELWRLLNVNVGYGIDESKKAPNRSILAYIVEGHEIAREIDDRGEAVVYQQLPRGILAIEGSHRELLSEKERDSLRILARSFAHLVRHVFHDNTLLDYRPQLSRAYYDYGGTDKTVGSRLILSAMSVDVDLLSDIIEIAEKDPSFCEHYADVKHIYEEIFEGTEISDDMIRREELVKERIGRRFEKAADYLDRNSAPPRTVIDFLEACPRNFAWAGYAPSLAQALGDRADHRPPEFTLMSPGYSASGLYMALVEGEIRQVAKLSRVDKLRQERKNYRVHVRYKIIVAARAPTDAFAFDSTGEGGLKAGTENSDSFLPDEKYDENCYGVLVADLASSRKLDPEKRSSVQITEAGGAREVATFLDRVFHVVVNPNKSDFLEVVASLRSLFEDNLGHWYSTDRSFPDEDVVKNLREAFRLNYEDSLSRREKAEYQEALGRAQDPSTVLMPPGPEKGVRLDIWWTIRAFNRLGAGSPLSAIEYEKELFPLEFSKDEKLKSGLNDLCIEPEALSKFCATRYSRVEGFNDAEKRKMVSIAHRDLNAQNIVWAGPIQSFMMIDFEHTGIGYWGIDQARLAVNTVVDFLSKSRNERNLRSSVAEVVNAASFVSKAWRGFQDRDSWDEIWIERSEDGQVLKEPCDFPTEKNQALSCLVQWIIWLIWQKVETFTTPNLMLLYQAELGFAVVKEYEYGMVNVRRSQLKPDQIKLVKNTITENKEDLGTILLKIGLSEEFDLTDTRKRVQFASVVRFLVARWILKEIMEPLPRQ